MVPGSENTDNVGHGTHVAGTAGGIIWGVSVKVLSDSGAGATTGVIMGIEWTAAHAKKNRWIKKPVRPSLP